MATETELAEAFRTLHQGMTELHQQKRALTQEQEALRQRAHDADQKVELLTRRVTELEIALAAWEAAYEVFERNEGPEAAHLIFARATPKEAPKQSDSSDVLVAANGPAEPAPSTDQATPGRTAVRKHRRPPSSRATASAVVPTGTRPAAPPAGEMSAEQYRDLITLKKEHRNTIQVTLQEANYRISVEEALKRLNIPKDEAYATVRTSKSGLREKIAEFVNPKS